MNTTKHQPATALPWYALGGSVMPEREGLDMANTITRVLRRKNESTTDAAYIAHAANAYPKLVEALRNFVGPQAGRTFMTTSDEARALLRHLGEEA